MNDTLEKMKKLSRCSTEEKIKLVQDINIMLPDIIEFSSNLELWVKINRGIVKAATEKLKDEIYEKAGNLNSKDFALEFPEYSREEGEFCDSESFELKIRSLHENTKVSERLLENMTLRIKNPTYGRHQLSRPMRIVGPIQIYLNIYIYIFFFLYVA